MLAIAFVLTLSACGKKDTSPDTSTPPQSEAFTAPENYASVLFVTINPQFKLYLDENNNVLAVEPVNDDAKTFSDEMDFENKSFEAVIETIIEKANEKGFVKKNATVNFEITEQKTETVSKDDILQKAVATAEQKATVLNITITAEAKETADNTTSETDTSISSESTSTSNTDKPSSAASKPTTSTTTPSTNKPSSSNNSTTPISSANDTHKNDKIDFEKVLEDAGYGSIFIKSYLYDDSGDGGITAPGGQENIPDLLQQAFTVVVNHTLNEAVKTEVYNDYTYVYFYAADKFEYTMKKMFNITDSDIATLRTLRDYYTGTDGMVSIYDSKNKTYRWRTTPVVAMVDVSQVIKK